MEIRVDEGVNIMAEKMGPKLAVIPSGSQKNWTFLLLIVRLTYVHARNPPYCFLVYPII